MMQSRGIQIFLGHASDDKAAVMELYDRLKAEGYSPWLDKLNLLPGDNWREEIPKAIKSSNIFIACLSPRSVDKDGYIQQELRLALMECASKSAGGVYLIPLRLEPCEIPDLSLPNLGVNLRDYHWLDYWEPGSFERLVLSIERKRPTPSPPILEAVPEHPPEPSKDGLQRFSFEVVTVDAQGQEQERRQSSAENFVEGLGDGVTLDMVRIPGGSFLMGFPKDESERYGDEGPQHLVEVPEFFMGRYPVTQAQWQVIADMEQVTCHLGRDPSYFKGANLPVERVRWSEAVEFCARLTRHLSGRYSLPSEAQWEYACRGGTITPFHFGATLTSDIANYDAEQTYGQGPKGKYREQTTEVGQFPANGFGLHDMHGSVWEWCQDSWHKNYEGAPSDGSAWLSDDNAARRVRRGGSWFDDPRGCRSAYRDYINPAAQDNLTVGFRLVCEARGL